MVFREALTLDTTLSRRERAQNIRQGGLPYGTCAFDTETLPPPPGGPSHALAQCHCSDVMVLSGLRIFWAYQGFNLNTQVDPRSVYDTPAVVDVSDGLRVNAKISTDIVVPVRFSAGILQPLYPGRLARRGPALAFHLYVAVRLCRGALCRVHLSQWELPHRPLPSPRCAWRVVYDDLLPMAAPGATAV